jgi:hypothetical protein
VDVKGIFMLSFHPLLLKGESGPRSHLQEEGERFCRSLKQAKVWNPGLILHYLIILKRIGFYYKSGRGIFNSQDTSADIGF